MEDGRVVSMSMLVPSGWSWSLGPRPTSVLLCARSRGWFIIPLISRSSLILALLCAGSVCHSIESDLTGEFFCFLCGGRGGDIGLLALLDILVLWSVKFPIEWSPGAEATEGGESEGGSPVVESVNAHDDIRDGLLSGFRLKM